MIEPDVLPRSAGGRALEAGLRRRSEERLLGLAMVAALIGHRCDVMQHTGFLTSYNERPKTDLVSIVHVPTPPIGLYSKKHALGSKIEPSRWGR